MLEISIQFVVIGQYHPSPTTSRHALTADQSDTKLSHGQVNPNADVIQSAYVPKFAVNLIGDGTKYGDVIVQPYENDAKMI